VPPTSRMRGNTMSIEILMGFLDGVDFELWTIGGTVAVIFCAVILRGFTGFGFAIAAVPLLSLIIAPHSAVPLAIMLQLCGGLIDLLHERHNCHWPSLRWLMVGAIVGSPIGVLALMSIPAPIVRLIIFAICALAVAALGFGFALRTIPSGAATALIGLSAGMFNGLAAMPGPPAVAYYMAFPLRPNAIRASLLVFFAITSLAAAASLLITGLLEAETALLTVGGLPIMFFGTWLGECLFKRSVGRTHRTISLLLLAVIAVLSGSNALIELLCNSSPGIDMSAEVSMRLGPPGKRWGSRYGGSGRRATWP
jgi:uncharacterized membrane protein YfcA